jgi:hypothetical protein
LDCIQPIVQVALLGGPIAFAFLSATQPLKAWRISALALWSVFVIVLLFAFSMRVDVPLADLLLMAVRTWPTHLIAFGVVIVGNSLVLRRFGVRWRRETKPV